MKARSLATFLMGLITCAGAGCQSTVQNQILILSEQNETLKAELAGARRRLGEVEERLAKSDEAAVSQMRARVAELEHQVEQAVNSGELTLDGVPTSGVKTPADSLDLFRFPPAYDFSGAGMSDRLKSSDSIFLFVPSASVEFNGESPIPHHNFNSAPLMFFPGRVAGDLIDEHPRRRE